jgi:hypothetical protein
MPEPNTGTRFINQVNSLVRQETVTAEIETVTNVLYSDKSDGWLYSQKINMYEYNIYAVHIY